MIVPVEYDIRVKAPHGFTFVLENVKGLKEQFFDGNARYKIFSGIQTEIKCFERDADYVFLHPILSVSYDDEGTAEFEFKNADEDELCNVYVHYEFVGTSK